MKVCMHRLHPGHMAAGGDSNSPMGKGVRLGD